MSTSYAHPFLLISDFSFDISKKYNGGTPNLYNRKSSFYQKLRRGAAAQCRTIIINPIEAARNRFVIITRICQFWNMWPYNRSLSLSVLCIFSETRFLKNHQAMPSVELRIYTRSSCTALLNQTNWRQIHLKCCRWDIQAVSPLLFQKFRKRRDGVDLFWPSAAVCGRIYRIVDRPQLITFDPDKK